MTIIRSAIVLVAALLGMQHAAGAEAAPTVPLLANQCSAHRYDTNCEGFDIRRTVRASATDCCLDCQLTPGCSLYTWSDANGGTCFLKSECGQPTLSLRAAAIYTGWMDCTFRRDVDLVGNDVGNVKRTRAEDCCPACEENKDCTAWTWTDFEGGTCWLKSKGGAEVQSWGSISGTSTKRRCLLSQGWDYVGNDIGSVWEPEPERCCDHCRANPSCKAFSWSRFDGGVCWLKSAIGEVVSSEVVVSGYPR